MFSVNISHAHLKILCWLFRSNCVEREIILCMNAEPLFQTAIMSFEAVEKKSKTQISFSVLYFTFMLSVNLSFYPDIPSPTRKKGSTSTSEDCVVPDIDDEDNVFNFNQPRVPAGMYPTTIMIQS